MAFMPDLPLEKTIRICALYSPYSAEEISDAMNSAAEDMQDAINILVGECSAPIMPTEQKHALPFMAGQICMLMLGVLGFTYGIKMQTHAGFQIGMIALIASTIEMRRQTLIYSEQYNAAYEKEFARRKEEFNILAEPLLSAIMLDKNPSTTPLPSLAP